MSETTSMPQGLVWDIFSEICRIPHPSGHEEKLAAWVADFARRHGWRVSHSKGGLLLERAAAPGFEAAPSIILQGHLDMVPQAVDPHHDMRTAPVMVERSDDWLHTGGRTTLGADNGIGLALSLAAMVEAVPGGKLSAVFTTEEETGLTGAKFLPDEFLQADYLLNLDSEEEGEFTIGCAGGARIKAFMPLEVVEVPAGYTGVELKLSGLRGGHSGSDINKKRGNALKIMSEVLAALPDCPVAEFSGGTLSNVIPSAATAVIAAAEIGDIDRCIEPVLAKYRNELGGNAVQLTVQACPTATPEMVWSNKCRAAVLAVLAEVPAGIVAENAVWQVPAVSNNLAKVEQNGNELMVLLSQRALADDEREALTAKIKRIFEKNQARVECGEFYPGWVPAEQSELLDKTVAVYRRMYDVEPKITVIHAGLECGILAGKNSTLQMISFGPQMHNVHSVNEKVSIESTGCSFVFLKQLLAELWRR